jgi:hypothetical protein
MGKRLSKEQEEALKNVLEVETDCRSYYSLSEIISRLPGQIRVSLTDMIQRFPQHIFRPCHLSDRERWSLRLTMAKWICPRLKFFIKRSIAYPSLFREYLEDEWESKEQYDEAIREGKFEGGGPEAWDKILQEMIFSFEYIIYHEYRGFHPFRGDVRNYKQCDKFYKKWGIKNPYEKSLENKSIKYVYKDVKYGGRRFSNNPELDKEEPEEYRYLDRIVSYNSDAMNRPEYVREIERRAQKGLELFGKYFCDLYD